MANPLTVPDLTLRLVKGTPLEASEMDDNLTILKDFSNSLASMVSSVQSTDGSLKDDTVTTAALQNRSVTKAKLADLWAPYYVDTSPLPNAFAIATTPPMTGYTAGMVLMIAAANTTTGATTCTINVDGLGDRNLYKSGGAEVELSDISAGDVFWAVYKADGTFEVISGGGGSGGSGASIDATGIIGYEVYPPADITLTALAAPYTFPTFTHGLSEAPRTTASLICNTAEYGFAVNDIVPLEQIIDSTGDMPAFSVQTNATSIIVVMMSAPYLRQPTAGGGAIGDVVALTQASWSLRLRAEVTSDVSSAVIESAVSTFVSSDFDIDNSIGGTSYGLVINEVHGLTFEKSILTWNNTVNVSDGDTATVNGKEYKYRTTLTIPFTEGEVLIGVDGDASLVNLLRAINHTGTPGADYSCAAANAAARSSEYVTTHTLTITAIVTGTGQLTVSESSATLSFGVITLATPKDVRAVAVCTAIDNGYAVGDEVDVSLIRGHENAGLSYTLYPLYFVGANSTRAWLTQVHPLDSTGNEIGTGTHKIPRKTTGRYEPLTSNCWTLRVYARL